MTAWPHAFAAFLGTDLAGYACLVIGASLVAIGGWRAMEWPRLGTRGRGFCIFSICLGVGCIAHMRRTLVQEAACEIVWETAHDASLSRAQAEHRPALIDFTADWCAACKQLERMTYVDPRVQCEMRRFVAVRLDATALDDRIQALFERYAIVGLPAVIFVDSAGNLLTRPKVTGYVGAERLLEMLRGVK